MRKLIALPAGAALIAAIALPGAAAGGQASDGQRGHADKRAAHRHHGGWNRGRCGKERRMEQGYKVIFDGSRRCFEQWRYTGGASMTLQRDGTIQSGPGAPGLGVLWYKARPYGDFSLRLQFRDDTPDPERRANSGVQVRFPAPKGPVPGCPTTFNGSEQNNDAWISVNCGHEVQINNSPDGGDFDPRKTGSIYGFADLDSAASKPTPPGVWNDLEITVIGQHYTVTRNGEVINEYENLPGVPFPGRPNDPDSSSRGLVGYIGLQAHGGPQDVVSFRNVRIRDISAE
jgi:3-keto-disaccharide hydrolase